MKNGASAFPATFFPDDETTDGWQIPTWLWALAVLALFAILHFAADMLPPFRPLRGSRTLSFWLQPENFVAQVWIPVKGIVFRAAVLLLLLPVGHAFYCFLRALPPRQVLSAVKVSVPVFLTVGLLCFPYQDGSGLSSMGQDYGVISADPFAVKSGFFYRRLLMPGLAYVLGFGGVYWYYIFSLAVTWLLIFLTALALQQWLSAETSIRTESKWVALATLSAATLSYIAFHYQFPGYTEQLGHVLVLLLALVPMRSQARWAGVALGLATHDLMLFVLLPIILFFFHPVRERLVALGILGAYGFFWLAAYRFQPLALVRVHTDLAPAVNTIEIFRHETLWVTIGALAAHKLFWLVLVWAVVYLLRQRQFYTALATASLVLTPLATLVVATDSSRLAGLGFLGVLLALAILWRSRDSLAKQYLLRGVLALNLLIPSIYVAANYHRIPRAGLYEMAINFVAGLRQQ